MPDARSDWELIVAALENPAKYFPKLGESLYTAKRLRSQMEQQEKELTVEREKFKKAEECAEFWMTHMRVAIEGTKASSRIIPIEQFGIEWEEENARLQAKVEQQEGEIKALKSLIAEAAEAFLSLEGCIAAKVYVYGAYGEMWSPDVPRGTDEYEEVPITDLASRLASVGTQGEQSYPRCEHCNGSPAIGTKDECQWCNGTGLKPVSAEAPQAERLDHLRKLQPNWNSYGTPMISDKAILVAEAILSTPGQATPTSDGGVQVEWHCGGVDLEFVIRRDGTLEECECGIQRTQPDPRDLRIAQLEGALREIQFTPVFTRTMEDLNVVLAADMFLIKQNAAAALSAEGKE